MLDDGLSSAEDPPWRYNEEKEDRGRRILSRWGREDAANTKRDEDVVIRHNRRIKYVQRQQQVEMSPKTNGPVDDIDHDMDMTCWGTSRGDILAAADIRSSLCQDISCVRISLVSCQVINHRATEFTVGTVKYLQIPVSDISG